MEEKKVTFHNAEAGKKVFYKLVIVHTHYLFHNIQHPQCSKELTFLHIDI